MVCTFMPALDLFSNPGFRVEGEGVPYTAAALLAEALQARCKKAFRVHTTQSPFYFLIVARITHSPSPMKHKKTSSHLEEDAIVYKLVGPDACLQKDRVILFTSSWVPIKAASKHGQA